MSIDAKIDELIAAVKEIAAALRAQAGEPAVHPEIAAKAEKVEKAVKAVKPAKEPELGLDDVTKALAGAAKKHGKTAVVSLLGEFQAKSARELKPADYAAVIERVGATLQ
jgi:hypothetical protein